MATLYIETLIVSDVLSGLGYSIPIIRTPEEMVTDDGERI